MLASDSSLSKELHGLRILDLILTINVLVRGGNGVHRQVLNLVRLEVGHLEIGELDESIGSDFFDQVVIKTNVDEALEDGCLIKLCDHVVASFQGLEAEVGQGVKVAQIVDLVVADVQPDKSVWNEGVVEPFEIVA